MNAELTRLFDQHAAVSFEKQLALAEVVADKDWQFDLREGLLSFGDALRFPAQLLGTESAVTSHWLWGWANPSEGISPMLLGSARLLKLLGEQWQIPELTEAQWPTGELDGHFFSLLACGICRAGGYYRAPYEGGAAFLLLFDVPGSASTAPALVRIASVFPQVLASLPVNNHRQAFTAYLRYHGLEGRNEGEMIVVDKNSAPALTGVFDGGNRLTRLEAVLDS